MKHSAYDLCNHWHPCDSHAVEKTFFEVEHDLEENARKTHHDVDVGVFNDLVILACRCEYLSRVAEQNSEWDEEDDVDGTTSIEVNSTKLYFLGSVGLRNERLNSPVHAHQNLKAENVEKCDAKTDPGKLRRIVQSTREDSVDSVD